MTALRTEEDAPRGLVPRAKYYNALAKIDDLQEEVARLKAQLEEAQGLPLVAQIARFVRERAVVLKLLAALTQAQGKVLTDHQLRAASSKAEIEESNDVPNLIKTYVCFLRRALKEAGAPADTIRNVWGVGYHLTPHGLAWVKAKLAEGEQ